MFSLIGLVLALSGGYLVKDYVHAKGLSGKLLTTFGDLRLWVVFLSAVAISGSVLYHAFITLTSQGRKADEPQPNWGLRDSVSRTSYLRAPTVLK